MRRASCILVSYSVLQEHITLKLLISIFYSLRISYESTWSLIRDFTVLWYKYTCTLMPRCDHTNVWNFRIKWTRKFIHDIKHQKKRSRTLQLKIRALLHLIEPAELKPKPEIFTRITPDTSENLIIFPSRVFKFFPPKCVICTVLFNGYNMFYKHHMLVGKEHIYRLIAVSWLSMGLATPIIRLLFTFKYLAKMLQVFQQQNCILAASERSIG